MRQAGIAAICIVLLLFPANANSVPVLVSVDERLHAATDYISYDNSFEGLATITTSFENIGSVGCTVQVRTDILKNGQFLYTSWSEAGIAEPGATLALKNYWFSESEEGNMTGRISVYYCDEVEVKENAIFTMKAAGTNRSSAISVLGTSADENTINVTFVSNVSADSAWILPKRTPIGWRIEPVELKSLKPGEKYTAQIKYVAPIKGKTETIGFYFLDSNSEFSVFAATNKAEKEEKGISAASAYHALSGAVLFALVFLLARENKKVRRLKKQLSRKTRDSEKQES